MSLVTIRLSTNVDNQQEKKELCKEFVFAFPMLYRPLAEGCKTDEYSVETKVTHFWCY